MFENFRSGDSEEARDDVGEVSKTSSRPRRLSTRDAFHAFAHRRKSWLSVDEKEHRPLFKWHIYDNNGSYNGWFDWLPLWMRVGYWSPAAVLFLIGFYGSMWQYRPRPLQFPAVVDRNVEFDGTYFWWLMDCFVFVWGVSVVAYARYSMGSMAAFGISYTGWSWTILSARAFLEAASKVLATSRPGLALKMATWGSSLRFPAAVAAFVTFTIWNIVLLPIIYFKATPPGKKRRNFLKFNFGFFMTNVHILNLPLAMINNVYGGTARTFGQSDLWVGYLVVALYSV
eukprot:CAMPEP_0197452696 /NCGR_PEP_ID=MMETSP1175-20131217/32735_1 /TAXON_ID=1003142 /ORGANISM="Triceratium dubium, Strain CCMP147" /LENGTH=284 /DNA_ID=CAMNT_0042985763 /DNA_START=49 /DNA_END=899 /DNA_ORIENTATION=+